MSALAFDRSDFSLSYVLVRLAGDPAAVYTSYRRGIVVAALSIAPVSPSRQSFRRFW